TADACATGPTKVCRKWVYPGSLRGNPLERAKSAPRKFRASSILSVSRQTGRDQHERGVSEPASGSATWIAECRHNLAFWRATFSHFAPADDHKTSASGEGRRKCARSCLFYQGLY